MFLMVLKEPLVSLNHPRFLFIMLQPSEIVLIRLREALIFIDTSILNSKLEYAKDGNKGKKCLIVPGTILMKGSELIGLSSSHHT